MKRFARKLVLFVLLGAITPVILAWYCAVFVDYQQPATAYFRSARLPGEVQRQVFLVHHAFGSECVIVPAFVEDMADRFGVPCKALGDNDLRWCTLMDPHQQYLESGSCAEARGWPMLCLRFEKPASLARSSYASGIDLGGGQRVVLIPASRIGGGSLPFGTLNVSQRVLPYGPIWPGFAINTIFYAAILWLPFAALGAFRRRRRIKRGLCPKCGYDLRGMDHKLCPECGTGALKCDISPQ